MDDFQGFVLAFGIVYAYLAFRFGDKVSVDWKKLARAVAVTVAVFVLAASMWTSLLSFTVAVLAYAAVRAL